MRAIKIYDYTPGVSLVGKRVIALGFFDGVHLGHREILRRAVIEAQRLSLPSAVFTFFSESNTLKDRKRIYSTKEKLSLISECGIDEIIIADFDAVKSVSAIDFIEKTLVSELGCALALSGRDFRFGKGAAGDTELLSSTLERLGAALLCPDYVIEEGEKISSSRIKKLLTEGDVKKAGELLGRPYYVKSEVKRGLGLGKLFGFPTVNTEPEDSSVTLRYGVYKCSVMIDEREFSALTNVGTCPTVSERDMHLETYIAGYEGDLYGKEITVNFLDFIRPEQKFDTIEQLKMQIKLDINTVFGDKE